jgi:hypothetical protein
MVGNVIVYSVYFPQMAVYFRVSSYGTLPCPVLFSKKWRVFYGVLSLSVPKFIKIGSVTKNTEQTSTPNLRTKNKVR